MNTLFYISTIGVILWLLVSIYSSYLNKKAIRERDERHQQEMAELMSRVPRMGTDIAVRISSRYIKEDK